MAQEAACLILAKNQPRRGPRSQARAAWLRIDAVGAFALSIQSLQAQSVASGAGARSGFRATAAPTEIELLIAATRVRDGALRIFWNEDLSEDAVLASASLPALRQAIEVEANPIGMAATPPTCRSFPWSSGHCRTKC